MEIKVSFQSSGPQAHKAVGIIQLLVAVGWRSLLSSWSLSQLLKPISHSYHVILSTT